MPRSARRGSSRGSGARSVHDRPITFRLAPPFGFAFSNFHTSRNVFYTLNKLCGIFFPQTIPECLIDWRSPDAWLASPVDLKQPPILLVSEQARRVFDIAGGLEEYVRVIDPSLPTY